MKPNAVARVGKCLPLAGILLLHGCNSPSSTPPSQPPPPPDVNAVTSKVVAAPDAPKRKPPAGMGNAIGQVLFDGKPAPGIEVQLCEDIRLLGGCSGQKYQGKTDKTGYYIIDKVKPGDYAVAVRVFTSNQFIYPTAGVMSAAKFKIEKDQSLAIRTVNLWKTDLLVQTPKNGATVTTGKPKFTWKAYPNAANYKVTIRTKDGAGASETKETSETSLSPDKTLLNGDYQWRIEAFNAEGTKISEIVKDATFRVTGQSGSSAVELLSPKASAAVAGAGVSLQWKAHPLASEYRVYLKGVKAKDPLLSFESMNGTSYKIATPLPADQYFWSVEAYQGADKVAGSPLQTFRVK